MKTIKTLFMGFVVALVAISFGACNSEIPVGNPLRGTWKSLDGVTTFTFAKDGSVTRVDCTERTWTSSYANRENSSTEEIEKKGSYFLTKESVIITYTYQKTFTEQRVYGENGYDITSNYDYDENYSASETYAYVVDDEQLVFGKRGADGYISEGEIYNKY